MPSRVLATVLILGLCSLNLVTSMIFEPIAPEDLMAKFKDGKVRIIDFRSDNEREIDGYITGERDEAEEIARLVDIHDLFLPVVQKKK